ETASAVACTIHQAYSLGLALTGDLQRRVVGAEVTPGLDNAARLDLRIDRKLQIVLGKLTLGLRRGQPLQQRLGRFGIRRMAGHAGAGDVDVRAGRILVGPEQLDRVV